MSARRPRKRALGRLALWTGVGVSAALLGVLVTLWMSSWSYPLPSALESSAPHGQRILDRHGQLLARRMTADQVFATHLPLDAAGPHLAEALVAAEDQRFWTHPGIDVVAISRALIQAALSGRAVSGASTITQQLARTTFERPRTLRGKWEEMARALSIERALSKPQILEHYLNRVPFGPRLVGAAAAAEHYFGKPVSALDWSETATLVGLLRGPALFDPTRRPELARRERDRVLGRLREEGALTELQFDIARGLPVQLRPQPPLPGARHWVRKIARLRSDPVLRSTLDGPLQREVEALVTERRRTLGAYHTDTTALSVVVLDNHTGDILAHVGSPNFANARDSGQNDGVLARRQPGSTLKPFIYALAIDELGYSPVTLLPDEPQHFKTAEHYFAPRNFDRKFRGQVRLRRALANSLNVPAVYTLEKLGEHNVLTKFNELGLTSLDQDAAHYGPALALGDGEITLLELAAAYACLARGGVTLSPRWLMDQPQNADRRVLSAGAAAQISEMLSDDAARREAFGAVNALDLPFPVAVKTGTSKGYRDTWTVGYTRGVTVAVWAGNFDGRPTERMTGASAAGPLFHSVFVSAARLLGSRVTQPGLTRPLHDEPLQAHRVCAEGDPWAASDCAHTLLEWLAPSQVLPQSAGTKASPPPAIPAASTPSIAYPKPGMVFSYDPAIAEHRQKLMLKVDRPSSSQPATLYLNGQALAAVAGQAEWAVRPGQYELYAESSGGRSDVVRFVVR